MSSGLPKWSKWLILLLLVVVIAGGSAFFIQNKVQTEARTAVESLARQNNVLLTIKDVRYSLLQNVLTFEKIEAKAVVTNIPMTYTIEQIAVINPNRSLALAVARNQIDDVRGLHPVADALEARSYVAGPDPVMTVALQRVDDLSVDMDVIHEFLKKPAPTQVETFVAMAEAAAYKGRVVSGMTLTSKQDDTGITATLANQVEKNYAHFTLESSVSTDTVIKVSEKTTKNELAFTIKKMTLERLALPKEFITTALQVDPNSPESAEKLGKMLLQGERPFIASFTLDDMLLVTPDLNVPLKSFRYENSSTKPFAMRLDMKGLTLPAAMVLDGPLLALVSDMPNLVYNASIDGIFPYSDPTALTKFTLRGSIDKLGSLELEADGLIDYNLVDPEAVADSYRLASMNLTFTEDGLAARGARMSQSLLGVDISKAGPVGMELIWNSLSPEQRTPLNRSLLEQFMTFLQKPGSISLTFTPPTPLTSDEIEELQLTPEMLKLNITTGPKTLNELVQALPKQ